MHKAKEIYSAFLYTAFVCLQLCVPLEEKQLSQREPKRICVCCVCFVKVYIGSVLLVLQHWSLSHLRNTASKEGNCESSCQKIMVDCVYSRMSGMSGNFQGFVR